MSSGQVGQYRLINPIGEGGMSSVYLAEREKDQKRFAIKILKDEFSNDAHIRNRFIAEGKNLKRLKHPNLVRAYEVIEEDSQVAIAMEYVDGITLKDHMFDGKPLSKKSVKLLFSQMLDVLGFVHEKGLIHRDIKPSNFMLDTAGQIKLFDFGIVKNTDAKSPEYTTTSHNQVMGTTSYMSPEQVKSTRDVTHHSDIYSMGVVLWEMVMGKRLYNAAAVSRPEIEVMIIKRRLPLTNTSWDSVIQKATEKNPEKRFAHTIEFQSELNKAFRAPGGIQSGLLKTSGGRNFDNKSKKINQSTGESDETILDHKNVDASGRNQRKSSTATKVNSEGSRTSGPTSNASDKSKPAEIDQSVIREKLCEKFLNELIAVFPDISQEAQRDNFTKGEFKAVSRDDLAYNKIGCVALIVLFSLTWFVSYVAMDMIFDMGSLEFMEIVGISGVSLLLYIFITHTIYAHWTINDETLTQVNEIIDKYKRIS
jgi:serine/threonine protein kinase